jgi:hypothetical protein
MFAFIASAVLGGVAECGNCGSRGKNNVLPLYPMPTTKKASSFDRRKESYVIFYPEDIDGSPLKSRRDSFPLIEERDPDNSPHHCAIYNAELSRCSVGLAKELKKERRRLAGPRESLSSAEQSSSEKMRMTHRRTMDNLRSRTKDSLSTASTAPTFVAAVKTPHMMRKRCETDASVESDVSPTKSFNAENPGEAIDTLYEFGEVSKRVEAIRDTMKTDPIPKLNEHRIRDSKAGTARHSRFVQQQREQQRIKAEIQNYQGILGEKLGRLGSQQMDGVGRVERFRKTEDPAEAVRDGVLRYHKRCSEVFENSMSNRQFHMLEGFKKDLAD